MAPGDESLYYNPSTGETIHVHDVTLPSGNQIPPPPSHFSGLWQRPIVLNLSPDIFLDLVTKQIVHGWSVKKNVDAASQLAIHLEERFALRIFTVVAAKIEGDILSVRISTPAWPEPREFVLSPEGSFMW